MARKQPGWPTWRAKDITPELTEEICQAIRDGTPPERAAEMYEIPAGKLRQWISNGVEQIEDCYDGKRAYPSYEGLFALEVRKAIATRLHDLALGIKTAGKDDEWRAWAWLLERLERDYFSPKVEIERGPQTIIIQSVLPPGIGPAEVIEIPAADVKELPPAA